MNGNRVDKLLVDLGLAVTRSQAKQLIQEGVVFCDGIKITKPSANIAGDLEVRKENIFVSRGAHKLEKALAEFTIDPQQLIIADIGASTGGFTDLLLSRKAKKIYAIDVGHDQLAEKLKNDERVANFEGVNIRYGLKLPEKVDLCVVDLSYISLKLVLRAIFDLLTAEGEVIALVKPQFEVGREKLGKNGLVKNSQDRLDCLLSLYDWCSENKYYIKAGTISPLAGKTGNIEYLFYITRQQENLLEREKLKTLDER